MMRKLGLCLVGALGCVLVARCAGASGTLTGETGLVMVPTTDVLDPLHLRLGVYGDGKIETDLMVGDREYDRVDFSIGIGLLKNLEFYTHLPIVYFTRNLANKTETTTNGGLRLGLKYRLLDEANGAPFSAALLTDIVVGIGNDTVPAIMDRSTAFGRRETYEVMGIVDRTLWKMPCGDPAVLTLNAGGLFFDKPKSYSIDNQTTEFRRRFVGPNTTFDTPFEFAAALDTPLLKNAWGKIDWTDEFRGNTGIVQELRGAIPMQLFTGMRYALVDWTGLTIQGGIDFGLSGVLDGYRFVAGMTWQTPPPAAAAPVVAHVPPPPPPPPAPVAKVKKKIVLRGVHFDYNKADIRPDSAPILTEAAATLNENRDVMVVVEGHTDSRGSDAYNDKLSLRRATAVRDYLVKLGVAAERMSVVGKGKHEPVADNQTDEGRAQNRRVELLVQ